MGDPRPIETVVCLPGLVVANPRECRFGDSGIPPIGYERRHPAERERTAPVAGLDEQLGVRAHERDGHRDLGPIRQDELLPVTELLDDAEHVVPAAGVESGAVIAELVEDLVHLEREGQHFDEHGRFDRSAIELELVLGPAEDLLPEPRLEVALELGQIEIRTGPTIEQTSRVVERVQAEVDDRAGDRETVGVEMLLDEMPSARADDERRRPLVELVFLPIGILERDRPQGRVDEVLLSLHEVRPGRRVGVLEVRHVHRGTRVEGVDDHLSIGGTGDLNLANAQILGDVGDPPAALAHVQRVSSEVERPAAPKVLGDRAPLLEEPDAYRLYLAVEAREIRSRGRRSLALLLEVRNAPSIRVCFERLRSEWGGLEILVNNAGTNIPTDLESLDESSWDTVVDTDLKGVAFVTQAALPLLADGGRIVNVASIYGVLGRVERVAYSAAKGGVVTLTKSLALELAPRGITVNAVGPSLIETDLTRERMRRDPSFREQEVARTPLGRLATPADVAAAVVYFPSTAAGFVAGQLLLVDAGPGAH